MLIELADITIEVLNKDDALASFFAEYKSENEALFSVYADKEDVEYEKEISEYKYLNESSYLLSAIYRKICDKIIDYDVILFHSSALIVDDLGLVFSGISGAGKSTHASLYCKYLNAKMINDDKPLIRMFGDKFVIYGTPFSGKHSLNNNIKHKIDAICFIKQAKENKIRKLETNEKLTYLLNQTYRPSSNESLIRVIKIVNKMANMLPIYELECDISKEAVNTSYERLKRRD